MPNGLIKIAITFVHSILRWLPIRFCKHQLLMFYGHALLFWVPLNFRYRYIGQTAAKFATFREVKLPVLSSYFTSKIFLSLKSCRSSKLDFQ